MDISQIITLSSVVLANIGTGVILFTWSANKTDEFRKELTQQINENRKETSEILRAIQEEMKDFHGRLIALEKERGR